MSKAFFAGEIWNCDQNSIKKECTWEGQSYLSETTNIR